MAASGLRIFSIFGIDVNLHWTFILMLLIVLLLGSYVLFLLFVLLFACVFIHELSHSVTALRNRIKVREIVLLPIGGASVIDNLNIDPQVEFNISVVGPISSLLLGGIFGILVVFSPPGLITELLQYLFIINMFLGVSNLIPAFPMDGGRVLKSYLEERMDSYKATMLTVRISKYMIALIVVAAIVFIAYQSYSIGYKAFEFIYTMIIVFFLYGGAQSEEQNAIVRMRTEGVRLSDVLSRDYSIVDPKLGMKELYSTMKRTKRHRIFTKIKGSFYYIDLSRIKNAGKAGVPKAGDLAVPVPNLNYKMEIMDALAKVSSGSGIAVVTRNGRMTGMVTEQGIKAIISLHMANR